jgi:hypothetical protein
MCFEVRRPLHAPHIVFHTSDLHIRSLSREYEVNLGWRNIVHFCAYLRPQVSSQIWYHIFRNGRTVNLILVHMYSALLT